jgi:hypothetical protein
MDAERTEGGEQQSPKRLTRLQQQPPPPVVQLPTGVIIGPRFLLLPPTAMTQPGEKCADNTKNNSTPSLSPIFLSDKSPQKCFRVKFGAGPFLFGSFLAAVVVGKSMKLFRKGGKNKRLPRG